MNAYRLLTVISLFGLVLHVGGCAEPVSQESAPAPDGTEPESSTEIPDRLEMSLEALEVLSLSFANVEEQELSPSVQVPAELVAVPDRQATVGPRVAGRIAEVRVNVGDQVRRGAVLAVLDSEAVGGAWADLIAARARARVARQARDRQRRLLEERVTSQRAAEEAEGALAVAEADLQAAQTRLATFGVEVSEGPPPNPARVTLTSPLGGTVVGRWVNVGQWADPTDPIIEVVDLDEVWLEAAVYERDMRLVRPGQVVQVEVRAFPDEVFTGTVSQVASTLDELTRTVAVRVVMENPDHQLRPGMFATARILGTHAHEPRRLLAIPWAAVQQIDDHRAVFVHVGEGVFELRRVHTGERAGDFVEVLNGLNAGERVVTEGSFLLKGQLLRATLGEDEEAG